jgi:serine/threonine-protein kinase
VIGLEVSRGAEPVLVPSLLGDSFATAERALVAGHLRHKLVPIYSNSVRAETVITWSLKNQHVPPGTLILVTISKGPAPRLVPFIPFADNYAEASQLLRSHGFHPVQQEAYSDKHPVNRVVSVMPNYSNGPLAFGTTVTVTTSLGPRIVRIPDFIAEGIVSVKKAVAQLDALGFTTVKVVGSGFVVGVVPFSETLTPVTTPVYVYGSNPG